MKKEELEAKMLDLRGHSEDTQLDMLIAVHENAVKVWAPYEHVDPRLKETSKVLVKLMNELRDYRSENRNDAGF